MEIVKPSYYDKFTCTADKCPYTCCREWKINVDKDTLAKWKKLDVPGEAGVKLATCTYRDKISHNIRLNKNSICPLLTEEGLCRVVLAYGEETLSKTCHTFPRESHEFAGRTEQTLAAGCPAVLDLLFDEKNFSTEIAESTGSAADEDAYNKLRFSIRKHFISIMQDTSYTPSLAMKMIFFIALDLYHNEDTLDEEYIRDTFSSDSLSELSHAISNIPPQYGDTVREQNELFLDLSENYRNEKKYTAILEPLAQMAEQYETRSKTNTLEADRRKADSVLSSYTDKIRLLLAEELYSTSVMPDEGMYGMLLKLEWLGIYLATLTQALFLRLETNKNGSLPYEDFREMIVILTRMTGYSDEDIEEYLYNSFENAVWDFGYMNLIL